MFKKVVSLILILLLGTSPAFVRAEERSSIDQTGKIQQQEDAIEARYHTVLEKWVKEGVKNASNFEAFVSPSKFINVDKKYLLSSEKSKGYGEQVFYWNKKSSPLIVEITVPRDGLYELSFEYYPLSNDVIPIEGSILINNEFQYYESRRIVFPTKWKNAKDEFDKDRFGNEIVPKQEPISEWSKITAQDASHLQPESLKFYLKEGKNEITLSHLRGEMLIGKVYIHSPAKIPTYKEYREKSPDGGIATKLIINEAEKNYTKNSSYIRPIATVDASVVPNDPKYLLLNTLGGESWDESGQRINWQVTVEENGYYQLTFKVLQNKTTGGTVFRNLYIDGEIPFLEAKHIPFPFSKKWTNVTIADENGEPYLFYLTKGSHEISLEADASPLDRTINNTNNVIKDMQDLALSIKKLTGNQTDKSREWNIKEFFPNIQERFAGWIRQLEEEINYLSVLYKGDESKDIASLNLAVKKLKTLSEKPNEIPNRLTELTEGSSSVAQLLGNLLLELPKQPLLIDRFYVHGENVIPEAGVSFWKSSWFNIKRFVYSFTAGNFSVDQTDKDTLEVWVNRPRQYVELIQNLADQTFTKETGIQVKFSVMPDEGKLILASAANNQPDVAIGVSNWLPYELAIRGAVIDLHQFPDFESFSKHFSPGAFLPLMIDDSVYAIPETQDFFVQFYRKDILGELNVPVPDTWDEVVQILPELQRFGMNYYTPIAGATGFKPFHTTVPYIYQFNGKLYSDDGMRTAINEENALEAIQFMTDLNTIYSLPMQVPNFYNHFRYGTLPIGISSFTTYVQLTSAAPEIAGWWDIAPHPGMKQPDGTVARWATGSAQSAMIFKGTKAPEKSWEFLKWWMSTETQTEFAYNLQLLYGPEYMWNTANLDAFKKLPWPEEHKKTILAQWEYLKEVPKTPGSYMLEREISNIWNKIVFDGVNTREAIDDSVITINREITRKMEEFGYMKNGKIVRPYHIPTIEQVKEWEGRNNEEN